MSWSIPGPDLAIIDFVSNLGPGASISHTSLYFRALRDIPKYFNIFQDIPQGALKYCKIFHGTSVYAKVL